MVGASASQWSSLTFRVACIPVPWVWGAERCLAGAGRRPLPL